MARSSYLAAAAVVGLVCACRISSDLDGAQFACDSECPEGLECVDGRCIDPTGSDDAAPPDGPGGDAAVCECLAESFADDCGGSLADINAGMQICASTELNTNAVLGCPGAPQPGADAAFRIGASAGQTITATVRPEGFDVAIYIARDCSGSACDVIADDAGIGGTETATVAAPDTADYFVIVDSPSGSGCYELEVALE